jgi:hypothetical protein
MNFELNFFLNNLLFLLVQTKIKRKKRKSKTVNENRLTANYFWSVLIASDMQLNYNIKE